MRWFPLVGCLLFIAGCSYSSQSVDEALDVSDISKPAIEIAEKERASGSEESTSSTGDAFLGVKTGPVDADAPSEFATTATGLKYRILRKSGKPKPPSPTSRVLVHYHGWLPNLDDPSMGDVFDSSYDRGEPIAFRLNEVIPGWTEGVQLIEEGGMAELEIPAALGYGVRGHGPIPPNATLRFIVELIEVPQPPKPGSVDADAPEEFTTTASGLKHRLLREGSGASPESTSEVTVHYRGWIPEPENPAEGLEFDSSYERGEPITFPVQGVIQGWIEGIQLMKTGGMIELEIPPDLGYGDRDIGDIPANSTLRFIIELLEVK